MTLVDLYRLTLERLQVAAAGEASEPEDVQGVAERYPLLYDMLLTKGLVAWGLAQDVPAFAALPVVDMLAYICSGPFGKNPDDYAALGALDLPQQSIAERQLRQQLAKHYINCTQRTEYF